MLSLTDDDMHIMNDALAFARANRTRIAREFTSTDRFPREIAPVSLFMAGSPGAGKTEFAKALIRAFEDSGGSTMHIDLDELREHLPAYNGGNAHLFQPAANLILEKIHDIALKQGQSFILDGTLAKIDIARRNIARSLKRNRIVKILYVYQDPMQAWRFVQAREATEGRRILPDLFVDQYFSARQVVNTLKKELSGDISVDLLVKNIDGTAQFYKDNIDNIDNHLREKYDRASVFSLIESFEG